MNNVETKSRWQLLGQVQGYAGYIHGCRYPALVFDLEGEALSRQVCDALSDSFSASCPTWERPAASDGMDWRLSIDWLLSVWQSLQSALGLPVFETGRILALGQGQARCVVPTLINARPAMAALIQYSIAFVSSFGGPGHQEKRDKLQPVINNLKAHGAKASNVPRFVKAAFELGYPMRELPDGSYQYGIGRNARWMDGSFTDVTPNMSAKFARNKVWASDLLRQAGLPVAPHRLVGDIATALKVAEQLGYPVVVKPADRDGGIGVAAGLETEDEVREAIAAAQKYSPNVLVEKHVQGRDYRVTVFNGRAIWAVERVPGGVTGDGQHTVRQLVDQLNTDPRRGGGTLSALKALVLDAEALRLLENQGLTEEAVPAVGQFVRLRRAANVASGGTPVAVFDKVHPDNARLAVRATQALRLDMAGIDLLIPDIAVSWRETGAFICEVNGQPTLGQTTAAHLYAPILRHLVPGSGRVPVFAVVGAAHPNVWIDALSAILEAQGVKVGSVGPQGVRLGSEWLTKGPVTTYAGGQMLALHRAVGAIVVAITDAGCLQTGLPFDRIDGLILAGTGLQSGQDVEVDEKQLASAVLNGLLPACDGVVMTCNAAGRDIRVPVNRTRVRWHALNGEVEQMADAAVQLVLRRPDPRRATRAG